jgi:hypothetical protein
MNLGKQTMSPKIIINRLELGFWNTIILIMENSKLVRNLTPVIYKWLNWGFTTKMFQQMLYLIVVGLVLGYFFGIAIQFF